MTWLWIINIILWSIVLIGVIIGRCVYDNTKIDWYMYVLAVTCLILDMVCILSLRHDINTLQYQLSQTQIEHNINYNTMLS